MADTKKDDEGLKINVHETFGIHDVVDAEVIKVTTIGPDQKKHEQTFTTDVSSATIVSKSTEAITTTTTTPPPEQLEQLVETVDFAKSHKPFISRIKVSVGWKDGFQFEVERSPSQITKTIKKG